MIRYELREDNGRLYVDQHGETWFAPCVVEFTEARSPLARMRTHRLIPVDDIRNILAQFDLWRIDQRAQRKEQTA